MAPVTLGSYKCVKPVGRGSFGTAFLVQDPKGNELILKKIIVKDIPNFNKSELINEVKNMAKVSDHPFLVNYKEAFIHQDSFCIVMEYCSGGDLQNKIKRFQMSRTAFSEAALKRWLTQLSMGLHYLHKNKLLHRDSKNQIRLGDFGLSKSLNNTLAKAKTFCGTPSYMAPEVCQQKLYDSSADMWALGVVMYEMATLAFPFNASSLPIIFNKICNDPTPIIPARYSKELRKICAALLHKDPKMRLSASQVLQSPILQATSMDSNRNVNSHAWHARQYPNHFNSRYRGGRGGKLPITYNQSYYPNNQTEAPNNRARNFCNYFSATGKCRNGDNCRFRHEITKVWSCEETKCGFITSCEIVNENDGKISLYLASKKKKFTHWVIYSDDISGNLKTKEVESHHFESVIMSIIFYNNCLFCGLDNGSIIVQQTETKAQLYLTGHKKSIHALTFIDSILISGSLDGEIKMWQFNNETGTFHCEKSLNTECEITCLRELSKESPNSNDTLRHLWVGGTKILIFDLQTFSLTKKLDFRAPCMSFLSFEDNMIAGFYNGDIRAYSYEANQIAELKGPRLSTIEGIINKDKPFVLHGTSTGMIRFINLTNFEDIGSLKSNNLDKNIKRIINLGQDHFLVCREDGEISIWKWLE